MTARLLSEDAAAEEAGVDTEAVRRWHALGLLERRDTPAGPRYPRDGIRALLASAWKPQPVRAEHLTPQQTSLILHAGTPTLSRRAREGYLTRTLMPGGRYAYDGAQVRAIAAERERLGDRQWWPPLPRTRKGRAA